MDRGIQKSLQEIIDDLNAIWERLDDEYDGLDSERTPNVVFEALGNAGESIGNVVQHIQAAKIALLKGF